MALSQALGWLCERPKGDFTVGWVLRSGWPGFAEAVLLPKPLELGRAARLVERVIFLGSMAGFICKATAKEKIKKTKSSIRLWPSGSVEGVGNGTTNERPGKRSVFEVSCRERLESTAPNVIMQKSYPCLCQ
jgi:hypothetical protein